MTEEASNNGEPMGSALALQMLQNLVKLNENIEKSRVIQEQIAESLASINDYHETWMRASEILIEKRDEGKIKFSVSDFVDALAEAAEEVMGEGEEEDEPGPEDPLVGSRH